MSGAAAATIHASAALVDGTGVLVRGPSGSGKSSLVLALILADRAANRLVADDRVALTAKAGKLFAAPPAELAGLVELRGHGILRLPHVAMQEIGLVVDLVAAGSIARLPEAQDRRSQLQGVDLPRLALAAGVAEGSLRVRAVLMAGFETVGER